MSATPSQRWLRRSSGFLRVISVLWIATAARASRILGSFQSGAEAVDSGFTRKESAAVDNRVGNADAKLQAAVARAALRVSCRPDIRSHSAQRAGADQTPRQ